MPTGPATRPGFPKGLQVLLVTPDEAHDLMQSLSAFEYEVTLAPSCSDAVDAVMSGHAFDVVLVQSALLADRASRPAAALRAATAALPLVLLAPPAADAAASAAATWLGLDVGAVDVLPSPPPPSRLRTVWQHAVRKYMGPRRLSTSSLSGAGGGRARGGSVDGGTTTTTSGGPAASDSSASLCGGGGGSGGGAVIGGGCTRRSVDSALPAARPPPLRASRRGAPPRAAAGRAAAVWRGAVSAVDAAVPPPPPRAAPSRDDTVTPPPCPGAPPPCVWGTPVLPLPPAPPAAALVDEAALAGCLALPPLCPPSSAAASGPPTAPPGASPTPSRTSDATAAGVPWTDLADALDDVSLAEEEAGFAPLPAAAVADALAAAPPCLPRPPLGLTLRKSPSLLALINDRLAAVCGAGGAGEAAVGLPVTGA